MEPGHKPVHGECSRIAPVLSRIGDKWTIFLVVMLLEGGPMRFNQLRRRVGGISQRMLTLTVRGWSAMVFSLGPCFRSFRRASITN